MIYKGKRKIIYNDEGKYVYCDYNNYNEYFVLLCFRQFTFIFFGGILSLLEPIKEFIKFSYLFSLWLIVIILFPISIPIMVWREKKKIFKKYGVKIDYKNYKHYN